MHENHYRRLAVMLLLSFITMYALMYAMVDTFGNVYMNLNQVYMAALMTAPMAMIEIAVMRGMYKDARLNRLILGGAALLIAGAWIGIRQQVLITDAQFLRSMIPHHAGAMLMCGRAPVEDPAVQTLCKTILASQQAEIGRMKSLLDR
jgi:uncharacterized protein (DUF305 family)